MPTLSDYDAVADARSPEELLAAFVSISSQLGFPLFTSMLVLDRMDQSQAVVPLANTPAAFLAQSLDPGDWKRDPLNKAFRRRLNRPFLWTQETYAAADAGDLWEKQAPFGYCNGVAVALNLEGKRHFVLGVNTPEKLPTSERRLGRLLADVQFLAVNAQNAALRLLEPLAQPTSGALTDRELEVLRWTMLSKDAQAIADILGVSKRTVQFHVENAIGKLGCENKHAAVLRALEYGLLRRD
jgi:DNA-binding CsgD family transcriptional regulator